MPPVVDQQPTTADIIRSAGDVAAVAKHLGVPPAVAVALGEQESGLDPYVGGDPSPTYGVSPPGGAGETSFGIFQLHEGGQLGDPPVSGSVVRALDPTLNAETALSNVAGEAKAHPGWTWGQITTASQGPADPAAYQAQLDALLPPNAVNLPAAQASKVLGNAIAPQSYAPGTALGDALGKTGPKAKLQLASFISKAEGAYKRVLGLSPGGSVSSGIAGGASGLVGSWVAPLSKALFKYGLYGLGGILGGGMIVLGVADLAKPAAERAAQAAAPLAAL